MDETDNFSEYQKTIFKQTITKIKLEGHLDLPIFDNSYFMRKRLVDWVTMNVPETARKGASTKSLLDGLYNVAIGNGDSSPKLGDSGNKSEPSTPPLPVKPPPLFSPNTLDDAKAQCYLNRYADLRTAYGPTNIKDAKEHWVLQGKQEGRNALCPSDILTDKQAQCYLTRYKDLERAFGTNLQRAKQHWIQSGKREGRNPQCEASIFGQ